MPVKTKGTTVAEDSGAEKIVIELKKKMVVLSVQPFDGDIDTEELLKIDYHNIVGEVLTFPVLFNRIANMRAEMSNIVAESKLDFEVYEAQLYKEHQQRLMASGDKKPSIKDVEASVLLDPKFVLKKKQFLGRQRDFEYLDSLYWSAQSKDTKLNKLSEKIRPDDFEKDLIEGKVNGIMIKATKKSIA